MLEMDRLALQRARVFLDCAQYQLEGHPAHALCLINEFLGAVAEMEWATDEAGAMRANVAEISETLDELRERLS